MTSYLQIENLTKSYGDRMLFDSVTFGVNQGDKIGIIAKNGTGKSTLMRIIAGKESPDSGSVTFRSGLRVGFVEQSPEFTPGQTVLEACVNSQSDAGRAIAEYEEALASGDADRCSAAVARMDALGAWDRDDRIKQLLHQLEVTDINAPVDTLSGGQRKRVAIARTIFEEPDLIMLDEPTNHLDVGIIEWLEGYLSRQNVTLLMVTHDRYFLDRVCNKIIEIDRCGIFTYQGNYAEYLRRRAERIEAMGAELAKVRNTLRREQEWMNRQPQARAGKAKYRIDSFYDLKERSRLNLSEQNVELDAVSSSYIGSKIFEARHISKRWGDKVILDDFNYVFSRYEKLGIIGHNGVGKSTFIKMLLGMVEADSGTWDIGETVKFGYYSQDGIDFPAGKKVIDAVSDIADYIVIDDRHRFSPMQFLTHFLFSPADQQKYIETLSGGEKARLHLAIILMRRPNFLILDEPTNDLDIVTLGILEDYLSKFGGCLIVVSHDRFFLDSIADHLFVMEGEGRIKDFPGTYTEYRAYLDSRKAAEEESQRQSRRETAAPVKPRAERPRKLSWAERRELEALTTEIDALTLEKNELDTLFASGTAIDDIETRSRRYTELTRLLDEKEMRWLELSELE